MRMNRKLVSKISINTFATLLAVIWWVAIVWMIVVSILPAGSPVTRFTYWFTGNHTLDNFRHVLNSPQANIGRWFMNSIIVSVISTAGTLIFGTLAAFAFSRIHFPGKNLWFWLIVISIMIPTEATLIPLFVLIRDMDLLNTYASLILPRIPSAFGLIILKQFIDALPNDLFEAAKMDGAGWSRILWSITVPLCKPAIASLGIFVFLGAWNDFTWPFISITDPNMMTLPVGLPFFDSQFTADMAFPMAANTLAAVPALVAFFLFQKYIIKGITFSGMKL